MPPGKAQVKRCPVDGCKVRLEGTSANTKCAKCGLHVCTNHIFPSDHVCVNKTAQAQAAGGPKMELIVEKKQAANKEAFPELVVKVNSKPSEPTLTQEEKAGPVVTSLVEDSVDSLVTEFTQAASRRRFARLSEAGKLIQALNALSNNKEFAPNIVDQARAAFGRVASLASKKDAIQALEDVVLCNMPSTSLAGCWIGYGMLLSRSYDDDTDFFDLLDKAYAGLSKIKDPQEWVGQVFSEMLRFRRMDCDPSLAENPRLLQFVAKALSKIQLNAPVLADVTVLRLNTLILAGAAHGMGMPQSLNDLKLMSSVPDAVVPYLVQSLAEICGREVEPYVFKWSKSVGESLWSKYAKGESETRTRASLAGKSVCRYVLGPVGIDDWVTNLVKGAKDPVSWRGKEYSLDLLETLIQFKSDLLHDYLPSIVLVMAACVVEAKKEVAVKASVGLDAIGNTVTNPETKKLMPFILDAIKRPDAGTDKCLSELMDATFVNSLNATSVALIVPVVTRALREGSADLKRRGATATGNVCALVRDVEDVRQFEQVIRAELLKLKEHSSPDVRKAAEKALTSLNKALSEADSHKKAPKSPRPKKEDDVIAKECVLEFKESLFMCHETLLFAQAALKRLVANFLVTPAGDLSLNRVSADISLNFGFLEKRELETLASSLHARLRKARALSFDNLESQQADNDEVLVDIKDMILAYASRVLLSKTRITLKRGHRYGIVGKIGVGKTTLASRLAKGDLENFPSNVSTYMVLHEVLQEDMTKTVHDYMGGTEIARETLIKVGFTDPTKLVSTLSGGWRMRLAIAKSMLANADLIVLDEPTNHVDVSGVEWLANYLKSLEGSGVTCVIVSHDYDFLTEVATDILHIHDQRLDAFNQGFAEFQKAFPEIAAALPKMNASSTPNPSRTNTPAVANDAASDGTITREATPAVVDDSINNASSEDTGMAIFDLLAQNESNPEAVASLLASRSIPVITFPDPGKLEGITSRGKPVMTVSNLTYSYASNPGKVVLKEVSCKLSLNSRIALRGANGQGKSTLMKLIVGELGMNEFSTGTIWKHHNLRVAYVAQHAIHHLHDHLDITPVQYLQRRYFEGRDKERGEMITLALDEADKKVMSERGEICGILSRVTRGKQLYYEIEVTGRRKVGEGGDGRQSRSQKLDDSSNSKEFRSLAQLEAMKKPHVIKLVKMYDEEMKYEASGELSYFECPCRN